MWSTSIQSTKCIGHLFGHARKSKTRETTDRLIQRKLKLDRRKSTFTVKIEIDNEQGIPLYVKTVRKQTQEVWTLVRSLT